MAKRDVPTPPVSTPGVSLSDDAFRSGIGVDFAVDARYAWDAGVAIGRYLEGLKEGTILGRSCLECRRILVPPRMFCEQCFRPTDAWVDVGDTGVVNTFSLCYITWDMRQLTEPEIPAVIDLDGATPGIGIMHKLGDVDPESVHTGMKVRAVWKPAGEREGSILDIAYWAPVSGGAKPKRSAPKRSGKAAPRARKKGKR
jgi:uncharacterized protein